MKVYLIIGEMHTQIGTVLMKEVLRIFSNKDNAKNFIKETYPEARYNIDSKCYILDPIPGEKFNYITKYFIEEWTIEDL